MSLVNLRMFSRSFILRHTFERTKGEPPMTQPETSDPFPFALDEMRCPICARNAHKGLTAELSQKARSQGMIGCPVHGPVQADIVIKIRTA